MYIIRMLWMYIFRDSTVVNISKYHDVIKAIFVFSDRLCIL